MYKDRNVVAWEQEAGWIIKTKWREAPLTGNVRVQIGLFYKFDRDIDSSLKLVLDVMAKCGVYVDDRQITSLFVTKHKDLDPRLVVKVGADID